MNITAEEIKESTRFFKTQPEHILAQNAGQMNVTHPCIAQMMRALESTGLPGYEVDEIMERVLVIWYVYAKIKKATLSPISEIDLKNNVDLAISFFDYFNKEKDSETAIEDIKYFRDPKLRDFAVKFLTDFYEDIRSIPKEVITIFFALLKCLEDKAIA